MKERKKGDRDREKDTEGSERGTKIEIERWTESGNKDREKDRDRV